MLIDFFSKYADSIIVIVGFAYAVFRFFKTKSAEGIIGNGFSAAGIFTLFLASFMFIETKNEKALAFIQSKADTLSLLCLLVAFLLVIQTIRSGKP